jgi:hypothetical protein
MSGTEVIANNTRQLEQSIFSIHRTIRLISHSPELDALLCKDIGNATKGEFHTTIDTFIIFLRRNGGGPKTYKGLFIIVQFSAKTSSLFNE